MARFSQAQLRNFGFKRRKHVIPFGQQSDIESRMFVHFVSGGMSLGYRPEASEGWFFAQVVAVL